MRAYVSFIQFQPTTLSCHCSLFLSFLSAFSPLNISSVKMPMCFLWLQSLKERSISEVSFPPLERYASDSTMMFHWIHHVHILPIKIIHIVCNIWQVLYVFICWHQQLVKLENRRELQCVVSLTDRTKSSSSYNKLQIDFVDWLNAWAFT